MTVSVNATEPSYADWQRGAGASRPRNLPHGQERGCPPLDHALRS